MILFRTLETVSATVVPFFSSPILLSVRAGSFTVVLVMSAAALAAMEISPSRITSFLMMTFFPALSAFPFSAGFSSVLAWLSAFNSAF